MALNSRPRGVSPVAVAQTGKAPWKRVKRALGSLALGFALFICVWVSRVFFVGQMVSLLIPLRGLAGIAWIAILGGALPSFVLGFAYGLLRQRNVLAGALVVAALACALELGVSSAAVPWWNFITWWVLPIECITVLVVFVSLALVGSRSLQRLRTPVRFRLGVGLFVLLTLGALTWPWLYSCIRLNVCKLVP